MRVLTRNLCRGPWPITLVQYHYLGTSCLSLAPDFPLRWTFPQTHIHPRYWINLHFVYFPRPLHRPITGYDRRCQSQGLLMPSNECNSLLDSIKPSRSSAVVVTILAALEKGLGLVIFSLITMKVLPRVLIDCRGIGRCRVRRSCRQY